MHGLFYSLVNTIQNNVRIHISNDTTKTFISNNSYCSNVKMHGLFNSLLNTDVENNVRIHIINDTTQTFLNNMTDEEDVIYI